jgi:ribosomal protein S18 acetylase RimI-like enzyme
MEWLAYVKKVTDTSGQIETKNKFDESIILEWKKADILSPDLALFKKTICELASEELSPIELEFLRAYPDAVSHELFLRPCAPLLENGLESADWKVIQEKIQATINEFYLTDLSKFGPEVIKPLMDDIYFFATVKNKEKNQLLGFIMFSVTPALPFGDVKVINLVIRSMETDRGLEKVLMSAIFKLIPETKRIFFLFRPTNKRAMQRYHALGFTKDNHLSQDPNHKVDPKYFVSLEYKAEQSKRLHV